MPLTQVSGHVLDFDDYTVVAGVTYVYRVIPMSSRGVPNFDGRPGGRYSCVRSHDAGLFPRHAARLRLKGQPVGVLTFEGRDAHFEWDPTLDSGLFSETFFVQDYIVEIWAPGQQYLMRRTTVPARGPGVVMEWTYTLEQNAEDQIRAGSRRRAARLCHLRVGAGPIPGACLADPGHHYREQPPSRYGRYGPSRSAYH